MEIITGTTNAVHVQSSDDRIRQAAVFGFNDVVLPTGKALLYDLVNVNTLRIYDGDVMMQGTHGRIRHGGYDDIAISNGTSGYNRNDIVIAEYNNTDGLESIQLKLLKGTLTTGSATDPVYTSGDILSGDVLDQMPLYRIRLTGLTISGIDKLFAFPDYGWLANKNGGNYNAELIELMTGSFAFNIAAAGSFTGTVYYDEKACMGVVATSSTLTAGTAYTVCTLPSGYRPSVALKDWDSAGNIINISIAGIVTLTPAASLSSATPIRFYKEFSGGGSLN